MDDPELEPAPLAGPTAADADQGYDPGSPDPAVEAEDVRRQMAARTARSFVRNPARMPAGMTELAPVKVASDEEYQALQAGAHYTDPEGVKRRKPYYVTDDASYDAVPEGEVFLDPEGRKLQKPKYEPLPFQVQTLYSMAVNDRERMKVLDKFYPGKVKASPRGELYVEDGETRLKGKGAGESWGVTAAQAVPALAATAGEIIGGIAGAAGGPAGVAAGAVAGGGVGGAAGQGFNELIMGITGVRDRTGAEAGWEAGKQGLLGAGGAALGRVVVPAVPGIAKWAKGAVPGALAKFTGAHAAPEGAVDLAVSMRERGILVPPSATMMRLPHIHNVVEVLDPAFRTEEVLKQSAVRNMEEGSEKILQSLGIEDAGSVTKPTSAVLTEEAGLALQARGRQDALAATAEADARLEAEVAATRARVMAEDTLHIMETQPAAASAATALRADQAAVQQLINNGYDEIGQSVTAAMRAADADVNSGSLWQQVADRLRAAKQAVVQRHRQWYAQADEVAGGDLPDLGTLPQSAEQFIAQLPQGFEQRYPSIVQRIRDIAGRRNEAGEWAVEPANPTFGQLHALRTELRNEVDWFSLPPDMRDGTYKYFSRQVDDVLHDATASPNLQQAAHMLDLTDQSYGRNIAIFNERRLDAVISGIRSGQPADPSELFDVIVRSGRSDLTREVERLVGPNLWNAVRAADVNEILLTSRSASMIPGEIDGAKFVAEVLKRHRNDMLEAVHGRNAAPLMRQAQNIQIADGTIPVSVRPGDTLTEIVQRIRATEQAERAAATARPLDTLEREVRQTIREQQRTTAQMRQRDPLGFLADPTVGATAAVDRILKNEDLIFEAARRFGENSPEFQMLRQIYAQRILRSSMLPGEALSGVSPKIQETMFPGISGDLMRTLAKEMDLLLGTKAARTEAGRSIMATTQVEHPQGAIPGSRHLGPIGKIVFATGPIGRTVLEKYYAAITWGMTHLWTLKAIQRGLAGSEAEKMSARAALRAVVYQQGAARAGAIGAGTGAAMGATQPPRREVPEVDLQSMGLRGQPRAETPTPSPPQAVAGTDGPTAYQSLVSLLESAREALGGDPTIAGGFSQAMSAIPGGGLGVKLYTSLLREAGTNPTTFKTVFGSLQTDKLSKAELTEVAREFTGLVSNWKTKEQILDAINKTFIRRARFENKIAP